MAWSSLGCDEGVEHCSTRSHACPGEMATQRLSSGLRLLPVLLGLVTTATAARAVDAPLVLARQQSAFAHDTLGGRPLTVTYWLINAGTEVLGEPLVATTLAPGVTLEAADPPARTRGPDVVIPLPAIPAGGAVLATLTLRVPSGAAIVDGGARAFADTRTRQVVDSLPPTALRATLGADPALLASTPEAKLCIPSTVDVRPLRRGRPAVHRTPRCQLRRATANWSRPSSGT